MRSSVSRKKKKYSTRKNTSLKGVFLMLVLLCIFGVSLVRLFQFATPGTTREEKRVYAPTSTPTPLPPVLRVPILLYHYVENIQDKQATPRAALNIPPYVLDQQIKTLQDDGYTFMTASELADVLDKKNSLPLKPVILTIDDGHWDLYTDILPILKKYNVKATAYIISGFIGGSDFLTQEQLEKVIQSGLVEVGAHTVHHVTLAKQSLSYVEYQVKISKQQLQDSYHIKVVSFAYPYGSFDTQAAQVVKEAGFTTSVSTVPGIEQTEENRFFLYRIRPGYRTGKTLLTFLKQETFKPW